MSPPSSLPEPFGEYMLTHLLGKGGMASVFRAVKSGLEGFQKEVAIKRIHPSLAHNEGILHDLINEARIGGQLKHPNIVEVYEFNKVEDTYYLALEYVDGWTLDRLIALSREYRMPLPPSVVLDIALQVAEALDYAHNVKTLDGTAVQLVHRDLKPANIIVSRTGITKLMDFGIAKASTNIFHTVVAGMTKGTPHYMSPEQVRGGTVLTGSSDLFSLGAVLYELTTGNVLFDGEGLHVVMYQVVNADVAPYVRKAEARVPGIERLLLQLLAREQAERPRDAAAVAHWLKRLKDEEHGVGPTTSEFMHSVRERRLEAQGQRTTVEAGGEPEFATAFAPALEFAEEEERRVAEARALADAEIIEGQQTFGRRSPGPVDTKGATVREVDEELSEEETALLFPLPGKAPPPTDQNIKPTRNVPGATKQMRRAPVKKPGWSPPMMVVTGVLAIILALALGWIVKLALQDAPAPVAVAEAPTDAPADLPDLGGTVAGSDQERPTPQVQNPTTEPRTPRSEPPTPAPGKEPTPAPQATPSAEPTPAPQATPAEGPTPERVAVVSPVTGTGYLSIKTSTPYARVLVDGTETGKSTPLMRLALRSGPHDVVLVAVEMNKRSQPRRFTLQKDESLKLGHYDFHTDTWSD